MRAFHNKPELKDEYLTRVRAHAAADEIIKGQYWQNGRGCAVGCTIHSGKHLDYEALLGIPEHLAHLEDKLFENFPLEKAKLWPELFLSSIEVGADLSLVFSKFIVRVLGDSERGCVIHAETQESEVSMKSVINLYERKIKGDAVSIEEWALASLAAFAAADAADADADATAAAAFAADAAAFAADAADADADATAAATFADAAADADADADDVRVRHYEWMADVLIEELMNAS